MTEAGQPPADDRVIAVALRWSLAAAVAAGAGVAAWTLWPRPVPEAPPAAALPTGPVRAPAADPGAAFRFEDVTERWRIDFLRTSGADGRRFLPETMGGGVAVWDVDGDGDLDLLFPDGDPWPDAPGTPARGKGIVVFLNDLQGGGRFSRARGTGLEGPWQGMGLALARTGADPRPEVLATGVGGVRLYRPDGDARSGVRWRDATAEAGLAGIDGWTTAAAFADFDRDGDLDLVLARYVKWSPEIDRAVGYTLAGIGRAYGAPTGFEGASLSYLERGPDGRFTDRTAARGLDVRHPATGQPVCKALGFVVDDVDADGDLDLFVANDTVRNLLFVNDGRGAFEERGTALGVAFDRNGAVTGAMGCDASHLRNDASLAIAVGNFANEPCSLYVTPGDGRFSDDAIVDGISAATRRALTFGLVFADLDRDGLEDLALANGHIEPRIGDVQPGQRHAQPAQAFRNTQGARGATFAEVPAAALGALAEPMVGRGLAWGDLDGDGRLELVEVPVEGAPRLLRNATEGGSALAVRLEDPGSAGNPDAIGALVELRLSDGRRLRRTVMPTRSYLSQVPPVAWFGMGAAGPEEFRVRWPDGAETVHAAADAMGQSAIRRTR
ncbi:MAG: CRTAC1 family protein [Planctomycetes bacterium]|nr:CRTAC1 family protein [Planctomycetota bacterium]